jgi:hypothetical protein
MENVDARPVDPRDVAHEIDEPKYRIYFWSQRRHDKFAQASDEWELTAADVSEALEWAQENARDRSFVMYVVVPAVDGQVLVRLQGMDPTERLLPE